MAKIRQYRPTFVTGFDNETVEFETQKELLKIKWVKNFSKNKKFHRYSIHRDYIREEDVPLIVKLRGGTGDDVFRHTLIAEYDNGYEWWVIGFIDNVSGLDLPEWKV